MAAVSLSTWDDVLGYIRVKAPELMRAWFSQLEPVGTERGVLLIRAQNAAQVRYLREHCNRRFAEAAQAATGRLMSVTFEAPVSEEGGNNEPAYPDHESEPSLNPDYLFENFVTGPFNRLAHAAAVAVAHAPGRAYNPLFIHGAVGLGKTHLLQAVCADIRTRQPQLHFSYITCEKFINHFIGAVENGELHRFRFRYRNVDVLVIDDVQFLAERERSQEEFFHTFNALHQTQRQIVMSADCSPGEIPALEERLVSRFNSGLVALVDRPDFETRMAIVRKKARIRCVEVPEEVVEFIAARVNTNTRELEGALIKVDAISQTLGTPISLSTAREALGEPARHFVTIPAIIEAVTRRYGVKAADLQGKRRTRSIATPRQVCMWLARKLTSHSLEEIGGYFGGRDHSTVLHAIRAVDDLMATELAAHYLVTDLYKDLNGGVPPRTNGAGPAQAALLTKGEPVP